MLCHRLMNEGSDKGNKVGHTYICSIVITTFMAFSPKNKPKRRNVAWLEDLQAPTLKDICFTRSWNKVYIIYKNDVVNKKSPPALSLFGNPYPPCNKHGSGWHPLFGIPIPWSKLGGHAIHFHDDFRECNQNHSK